MAGRGTWLGIAGGLLGLLTIVPLIGGAGAPASAQSSGTEVVVPRAPDGQYYADVRVGDRQIRALIDPDADGMFIAGTDAALLGLGDGTTPRDVVLPPMQIGPIAIQGIAAQVAPNLPVTIIGRPVLIRLGGTAINDGALHLR